MVISTLEFILGFTMGLSIIVCGLVIYKMFGDILNGGR